MKGERGVGERGAPLPSCPLLASFGARILIENINPLGVFH